MKQEKVMVTPTEAAEIYGLSKGSLANMRFFGEGPKFYKIGKRKVLYKISDLEEWLYQNPR